MKMKVLMIHNTVTNYRVPFFNDLSGLVDLTLVLFQEEENKKIYNDEARYTELKDTRVFFYMDYKEIDSLIIKEKFDVIILPGIDDLATLRVYLHFVRIKDKSIKAVFWGMWESPKISGPWGVKIKKYLQRPIRSWALQYSDIALTYGTKSKEYLRFLGFKKSIYPFINSTIVKKSEEKLNVREILCLSPEDKIVLYLGRVVERKGIRVLIDSLGMIDNDHIKLIVVGGGEDLEEMKVYAKEQIRQKKIFFLGHIIPEKRSNYYEQSDVFVIPSFFHNGVPEPWGLTVNEALQFKKPVIATEAVGAAFDLITNNNGVIVSENDPNSLKDGIEMILSKEWENIEPITDTSVMANNVYNALRLEIEKL